MSCLASPTKLAVKSDWGSRTLHHGRARTVGANSLRVDLLANQCFTIITALVRHHRHREGPKVP